MGALGSIVASRIAREFHLGGPSFTICQRGEFRPPRPGSSRARACSAAKSTGPGRRGRSGRRRPRRARHASAPALFAAGRAGPSMPMPMARRRRGCGGRGPQAPRRRRARRRHDLRRHQGIGVAAAGGGALVPTRPRIDARWSVPMQEAAVDPASVGYLETHGSGYPAEDRAEAAALAEFFGPPARGRWRSAAPRRTSATPARRPAWRRWSRRACAWTSRFCRRCATSTARAANWRDRGSFLLPPRRATGCATASTDRVGRRQLRQRRRQLRPRRSGRVGSRRVRDHPTPAPLGRAHRSAVRRRRARDALRPARWPEPSAQPSGEQPTPSLEACRSQLVREEPARPARRCRGRPWWRATAPNCGADRPRRRGGSAREPRQALRTRSRPSATASSTRRSRWAERAGRLRLPRFGQRLPRHGPRPRRQWPEVLRRQDAENERLRSQYRPRRLLGRRRAQTSPRRANASSARSRSAAW